MLEDVDLRVSVHEWNNDMLQYVVTVRSGVNWASKNVQPCLAIPAYATPDHYAPASPSVNHPNAALFKSLPRASPYTASTVRNADIEFTLVGE